MSNQPSNGPSFNRFPGSLWIWWDERAQRQVTEGKPQVANARKYLLSDEGYQQLLAFFRKYAIGDKFDPSCLVCGVKTPAMAAAITHAELPGIVVCDKCAKGARGAADPETKQITLKDIYYAMQPDFGRQSEATIWGISRELYEKLEQQMLESFSGET